MARYEYLCLDCEQRFEIREPMSEHDGQTPPECPSCGSRQTRQLLSPFFPSTSRKS